MCVYMYIYYIYIYIYIYIYLFIYLFIVYMQQKLASDIIHIQDISKFCSHPFQNN